MLPVPVSVQLMTGYQGSQWEGALPAGALSAFQDLGPGTVWQCIPQEKS